MKKLLSIFIIVLLVSNFVFLGVSAEPIPAPEVSLLTELSTKSGILMPKATDEELSDIIQNMITEMETIIVLLTGNSIEYLIDTDLPDEENIALLTLDIKDMLEDDTYDPGEKSLDDVLKDYFKYSMLVEYDVDYEITGKTLEKIMVDYYKLGFKENLDVDFGDEVFPTTADFFKKVAYKLVQITVEEAYNTVLEEDLNADNIVGIILKLYKTKGNLINGIYEYNLNLENYDEKFLTFNFLTIDNIDFDYEPLSSLKTLAALSATSLVESMSVNGTTIDLSKGSFDVPVNEGMNKIEIILKSTLDPDADGETYIINANISRTKPETSTTVKESPNPSLGESSTSMKVISIFGVFMAVAIALVLKKKRESQ